MKDSSKANQELLEENSFLNQRIKELEQAESDCKRLEEALRERDIKFKRFFSLVPGMIFQFTKRHDGTYCLPFATEAIRDLYGCSPEDVCDDFSPIVRVILPEDLDKLLDSIEYSAKHMTNWTCEYRVQIPGKSIKWTLGNSTPEKLADGSITWYGYNTDITDYKRIEAELRKSQEIFTQFMENSPIYIFFKDDNIRAIQLSRNYEKMLGRPLHELLGKNMYDLFPSDLAKAMVADDLRILNEGKQVTVKEELNGRFYSTVKFPINFEGKARYLAGYTIDVTESKQAEAERLVLEERLNRAEKMEALGTLAGGVAHDLNNVLGIVGGYAELLLMNTDKSSSINPQLVNIAQGAQRAAAIVDDLLTMTRRGVSDRKVLNLNKIFVNTQQSPEFEKLHSYHPSVKIKTDFESDLLNISGSSVHLSKTLFNLVLNACEVMPDGGKLTIKTANQYLDKPIQGYDEVREGDYVVLSVSDTGEGIPAADLKRIFEPFYTKKVMGRSGTGLGLAVVWGTVKDHHGYIDVQTGEGRGSTFTLYFPVTRENVSYETAAMALSEYMGRSESILVVDDVRGQRNLASDMLRMLNYNISSVSSGEEAIAYLKEHPVDLMVLDMIMDPGMNGLETYRSVIEINPNQKAIIVSGFSESDRVHATQALGAGDYVRKPYVLEKLGMAVRKELNKT